MAFSTTMSVPGRTGSHRSAVRAVGVSRGSSTIRWAPLSRACHNQFMAMGKFSATFDPTTRRHSASGMSVRGSGARSSPKARA